MTRLEQLDRTINLLDRAIFGLESVVRQGEQSSTADALTLIRVANALIEEEQIAAQKEG